MKSTNKHGKETAKSGQQAAFKTPAKKLMEFKAKVLALKHGPLIWTCLSMEEFEDDRREEWVAMVLAPFPAMLRQAFPNTLVDMDLAGALATRLLRVAMREVESNVDELWPEYKGLLECNPDELKAYRERDNLHRLSHDVAIRPRGLPRGPGRPREQKHAERDAQIVYMRDVQKLTFGKIARKLHIGREVGIAAYRRMKHNKPTRRN